MTDGKFVRWPDISKNQHRLTEDENRCEKCHELPWLGGDMNYCEVSDDDAPTAKPPSGWDAKFGMVTSLTIERGESLPACDHRNANEETFADGYSNVTVMECPDCGESWHI